MAEPENERLRVLEQARRAAAAFARGGDGAPLAPPEIRHLLEAWTRRLDTHDRKLDEEGWLIGLLTLARLAGEQADVQARDRSELSSPASLPVAAPAAATRERDREPTTR